MQRAWFVALCTAVVLVLGVGCDDDSTPPTDSKTTTEAAVDTFVYPDQAEPDQFIWPDQGQDSIIWPDTYIGTPFGCQSDSDCFGQKCCATPWGVKLCAATCTK